MILMVTTVSNNTHIQYTQVLVCRQYSFCPTEGRRLSSPGWLITYQYGPVNGHPSRYQAVCGITSLLCLTLPLFHIATLKCAFLLEIHILRLDVCKLR